MLFSADGMYVHVCLTHINFVNTASPVLCMKRLKLMRTYGDDKSQNAHISIILSTNNLVKLQRNMLQKTMKISDISVNVEI